MTTDGQPTSLGLASTPPGAQTNTSAVQTWFGPAVIQIVGVALVVMRYLCPNRR